MTRRLTREEQVIRTLKEKGHISEATGFAEYGRIQVASAIWRIKNLKPNLIPEGMEIRSVEKNDTNGNRYVEWQLRPVQVLEAA